jgi:hypothetical protein
MINFKIVLPYEVPVKKNTMKELWFTTNKAGIKTARDRPLKFYTKTYTNWIKGIVPLLEKWKIENSDNYDFPLEGEFVVTFLMFRKHKGIVDLSALYEALQDLLIGKIGSSLDRHLKSGTFKFNPDRIKILKDDNCTIIRNHGASNVYYTTGKPYVAIFISTFKPENTGKVMELHHPGLMLTADEVNVIQEQEQVNLFGSEDGAYLQFLQESNLKEE